MRGTPKNRSRRPAPSRKPSGGRSRAPARRGAGKAESDGLTGRKAVALVHPGLESSLAEELAALGIEGKVQDGMVEFPATWDNLVKVHQRSWIAGRVRMRLAKVRAGSLEELAHGVRSIPWQQFVVARQKVEVKVATAAAKLRRKDVVARKVELGISDSLRGRPGQFGGARRPTQEVFVRIEGDRAEISIDCSGELLHRRGWRQATAKAPLRENLASAMLHIAGFEGDEPVVDFMCGSGTFVIEAARQAAGMPVHLKLVPSFAHWPVFKGKQWSEPRPPRVGDLPTFMGIDRNGGAIEASESNARRAGVSSKVRFVNSRFEDVPPLRGPGLLVANMPYGLRVGSGYDLEPAYRAWGRALSRWEGWRAVVLVPKTVKLHWLGRFELLAEFKNGGVPVVVAGCSELGGSEDDFDR